MVDRRVINGSGSCARCLGSLDLDAVKQGGVWYCGPACAEGRGGEPEVPRVPEARLYARPRRFFGKRKPKELRCAG